MKIGILSLAHHHAEGYIRNLQACSSVEFLGFFDEDNDRSKRVATETGANIFPSAQALLAQKPDGVIVASENSRHLENVRLAAAAGCHVLCEKPLATSVEDTETMLAICKKAGVKLMTAFPMRFSPPLIEVKARLDAGELGRPRCITSSNQGQLPTKYRAWFVDPLLAGGGVLTDHIVHLSDIFRWYLGTEIVEVYAQSNHILHKGTVPVETGGMVTLGFEDSSFASIDCSWSRPKTWPTWGGLTFELVTDRGVIRVDGFSQNIESFSDTAGGYSLLSWGSDANQGMIEEFIACIREDREPSVSGHDGLAAVKIIHAAYESATIGQKVRV